MPATPRGGRRCRKALREALRAGAKRFADGETDPAPVLAAMRAVLESGTDRIDYVAAVDPDTLRPARRLGEGTVLLVAAHVGAARLIDNRILTAAADFGD